MIGIAFVFPTDNVHLYLPAASETLVSVPDNVVIFKNLKSVPDIYYEAGINISVPVPTITILISNQFFSLNNTLLKSKYFRNVVVWLVEFKTTNFEFELIKMCVVDTYSFIGSDVEVVLR